MTKYIAYVRVSTQKQGNSGLGLEAQREIIKYNVGEHNIVAWFREIHSAKNLDSLPMLRKAKELAKKEGYVLVVAKADRLRNTQQALDLVDELTPEGVFFCNVGRNADKFTLTLFFAFAEKERLEISIRTKAALARLKAKGVKLGRRPFAVKRAKLRENGKKGAKAMLLKSLSDPNNILAARIAIPSRIKEGMSYNKIASLLNESGIKTPTGKKWGVSSVYKLIKRFTLVQYEK